MIDCDKLIKQAGVLGVAISRQQAEQFDQYAALLIETNRVMNLTSITEPDEIVSKHFADSLALLGKLELAPGSCVIDVGTGAGFPGLPLKIARPDLEVVLLDSLNKRLQFLNRVIEELGLEKIRTVHARAEEGGRQEPLREQFDLAVSRAVARLSVLSEYCLPYVKQGGCFCALKGPEPQQEIEKAGRAIRLMGGANVRAVPYTLPQTEITHTLAVIQKSAPTPKQYPRPSAKMAKAPLEQA